MSILENCDVRMLFGVNWSRALVMTRDTKNPTYPIYRKEKGGHAITRLILVKCDGNVTFPNECASLALISANPELPENSSFSFILDYEHDFVIYRDGNGRLRIVAADMSDSYTPNDIRWKHEDSVELPYTDEETDNPCYNEKAIYDFLVENGPYDITRHARHMQCIRKIVDHLALVR